jgi:putative transposase
MFDAAPPPEGGDTHASVGSAPRAPRTWKARLLPTKRQRRALERVLEDQRLLYNADLESRNAAWRRARVKGERPPRISYEGRCAELTEMRRDMPEWLGALPVSLCRWTLKKADLAYRAFYARLKARDGRAGPPRFRGRSRWDSFGFREWDGVRLDGKRLRFKGMPGGLRVHLHRPPPEKFEPRSGVIGRDAKGWWVAIQGLVEVAEPVDRGKAVGIDVGVGTYAALSDGGKIPNPQVGKRLARDLRRRQRALARCRRGSGGRRKARRKLARAHLRLANARRDYAHKVAARLARRFALIAVEDLSVGNMTASARGTAEEPGSNVRQKAGLNRALLDVAPALSAL